MKNVAFWDVDTQRCFMNEKGRYKGTLPVPGAEQIKPKLAEITQFAAKKGIPVFHSMDWHDPSNPELVTGGGELPPHCMAWTGDARKIPQTATFASLESCVIPRFIPGDPGGKKLEDRIMKGGCVLKETINVFNEKAIMNKIVSTLKKNGIDTIVGYGVATDFCVDAAVKGFLESGFKVFAVEDAIAGIFPEKTEMAICEWKDKHAIVLPFDEIKKQL